jgi:transcriptional regulator of arginine metabolism
MKFQRQAKIIEIITQESVETQEELSERLRKAGFIATQATISRDIKELRLVKRMTDNGSYRYTVSAKEGEPGFSPRLKTIFRESVTSFDFAQNIVVIKTLPGLASAACSAIDSMNASYILGTLAGDDTGFLVIRDTESAKMFVEEIRRMLE